MADDAGRWSGWRRLALAALIGLALAAPLLLWREELAAAFANRGQLVEEIRAAGAWGPVVVIGLVIAQTIVAPIPGQIVNLVAGYIYGPWLGLLYSWLGMVIGVGLAMAIGRYAGRPVVERLIGTELLARLDRLAGDRGIVFFLLLFLIPGLPDDALCFAAGMTRLPLRILWPLAAVARLPGLIAAVLLGARAEMIPAAVWVLLSIAGAVGLALVWFYGARIQTWLMRRLEARTDNTKTE